MTASAFRRTRLSWAKDGEAAPTWVRGKSGRWPLLARAGLWLGPLSDVISATIALGIDWRWGGQPTTAILDLKPEEEEEAIQACLGSALQRRQISPVRHPSDVMTRTDGKQVSVRIGQTFPFDMCDCIVHIELRGSHNANVILQVACRPPGGIEATPTGQSVDRWHLRV